MKILNLYAGIGGNRKLWGDEHEITAVEYDTAIAKAYQDRYPNDTVVVGDAKQYLLDHYKEFDFIWASPPCQSHSRARRGRVDIPYPNGNSYGAIYPDISLYQIILLLSNFYSGLWVVENVQPYYKPLIAPSISIDRHLYWCNFPISKIKTDKKYRLQDVKQSDVNLPKEIKNKIQVIRNQVDYEVGKHILDCATGSVKVQGGLFDSA
jgi:DNA (cytosine-5)-methyltransferase 1